MDYETTEEKTKEENDRENNEQKVITVLILD